MNIHERNLMLYQDAYQYLMDNTIGLTDEILATYLECNKVKSLDEVFSIVIGFVKDMYRVKRDIILYDNKNFDTINNILHHGDLKYCITTYTNNPDKLYTELFENLNLKNKDSNFSKKVIKIYVNVICGMSKYLCEFSSAEDMYNYFEQFNNCSDKIKLVYEIQKASHKVDYIKEAWGFKLASNWLKDIGLQDYCKPDTHVTNFANGLDLTKSKTDTAVFRAIISIADEIKKVNPSVNAFKIDRLAYLIGSGDFYSHRNSLKYNGSMSEFIQMRKIKDKISR